MNLQLQENEIMKSSRELPGQTGPQTGPHRCVYKCVCECVCVCICMLCIFHMCVYVCVGMCVYGGRAWFSQVRIVITIQGWFSH